jgi:uncharacterized protein YndB with AHSA1/START domain
MEQKAQHGYLVLADISGYTSYLAGVELDHAQGVLTDLLETIVASFKSLLTISKLEGDAVFGYVPEAQVNRGETLIEFVEATYVAFRDRLEGIRRRTTCTCNACRAIPGLDLKFITHHGDYMTQSIAGIHELVGSDVNLVHRLLKNHVGEKTGWHAYALFTGQSLEHLVVPCDPRDLHSQTEHYEHLGEVLTYSLDLRKRYDELSAARHVIVTDEEADAIMEYDFPVPPAVLWDYLNEPARRDQWMPGVHWTAGARPGGRTGPGAQNHCAHGQHDVSTEVVMDWKPFSYSTTHQYFGKDMYWAVTYRLTPLPDGRGTHLHITLRGVIGKLPRVLAHPATLALLAISKYRQVFDNIPGVVAREYAGRLPAQAGVATPAAGLRPS